MNNKLPTTLHPTILALATPPGRAGVAVLRLSGTSVREQIPAALGMVLPAPRQAVLSRWKDAQGHTIDEGLSLFFPGPNSFTGEDVLELHCHGSMAVLETMQNYLLSLPGVRLAEPGEFSRRAYMNGKMDLLEAEGLLDLIHAETDAQRRLALGQMQGQQSQEVQALGKNALHALALLEGCIDFPDEDIPADLWQEVLERTQALNTDLARLLALVETGARIRDGVRVVIIGPPNAGKSSLLNALSKQEAAIVSPQAGTTRDAIEVRLQLAGQLVILADTAGLRATDDVIEQEGIRRAQLQQSKADIRLLMLDAANLPNANEWSWLQAALDEYQGLPTLIFFNKMDTARDSISSLKNKIPAALAVSATHLSGSVAKQTGLGELENWLISQLQMLAGGGQAQLALLNRARHRAALQEAQSWLQRFLGEGQHAPLEIQCEQLRQAAQSIGKITGKILADDVLGVIFSEFCIGK